MAKHFGLLGARHLDRISAHFDRHFGILVGELQSVVENLQVLLQTQRSTGQFQLIWGDEFVQSRWFIHENQFARILQKKQFLEHCLYLF